MNASAEGIHEFADARTPERRVAGVQEIERLDRWLSELPPKCRQAAGSPPLCRRELEQHDAHALGRVAQQRINKRSDAEHLKTLFD